MGTTFRLALQNLKEHKSKTLIIALFLIFGVAIVVLGNSFLESINRGLEKDFSANYTGDLVISAKPEKGTVIDIFGISSTNITGEIPQLPALTDIDRIQKILDSNSGIKNSTKQISAQVLFAKDAEFDFSVITENDNLELQDLPVSMLFAGESSTYWETFSGIHIQEGTFPENGSTDLLIDTRVKRNFEKVYKKELNVGDTVLLAGANSKGILREGKVCGIFTPANENSAMFQIIYCDPSFARAFADLTYAASIHEDLDSESSQSISEMDEDEIFSDLFQDDFEIAELSTSDEIDFDGILGDTTRRDQLNETDDNAWNFILAKVHPGKSVKKTIAKIRQELQQAGITNVQVMNWKEGARSYSGTVEGIGIIFNILIGILAIVVFIIIMNTMIVSVIERTSEIGTMRAIGASKEFVTKLFFTEAIFLTLVSSVIGIILASIIMGIFNSLHITITNEVAKMILGGGLLHFSPTFLIIFMTIFIAVAGSVISNIYPVSSALKITPLKALNKGSE